MEFNITDSTLGERPPVTMPNPQILSKLKEEGIRKIVSEHYDLLVQSPIKDLFPESPIGLEGAKKHSADFFVQVMGGHPHYKENRGAPMMTRRHIPFSITPSARLVWMNCYKEVLSKVDLPEDLMKSYWDYLDTFSKWMVNTPEKANV